jgi:hypothetical protein
MDGSNAEGRFTAHGMPALRYGEQARCRLLHVVRRVASRRALLAVEKGRGRKAAGRRDGGRSLNAPGRGGRPGSRAPGAATATAGATGADCGDAHHRQGGGASGRRHSHARRRSRSGPCDVTGRVRIQCRSPHAAGDTATRRAASAKGDGAPGGDTNGAAPPAPASASRSRATTGGDKVRGGGDHRHAAGARRPAA